MDFSACSLLNGVVVAKEIIAGIESVCLHSSFIPAVLVRRVTAQSKDKLLTS